MAGKYDVNEAIELLFDDEFSISGSEISEEEGEDAYCYRGEGCSTKEPVEDFGSKSVSSSDFSLDESEGNSEEQLEILSRGRLGDINQLVLFGSITILQH